MQKNDFIDGRMNEGFWNDTATASFERRLQPNIVADVVNIPRRVKLSSSTGFET
jgi:hypothetical protein